MNVYLLRLLIDMLQRINIQYIKDNSNNVYHNHHSHETILIMEKFSSIFYEIRETRDFDFMIIQLSITFIFACALRTKRF